MFRKAILSATTLAILSTSAFAATPASTSLDARVFVTERVVDQTEQFEVARATKAKNRRVEIKRERTRELQGVKRKKRR